MGEEETTFSKDFYFPQSTSNGGYTPKLFVDGANGVGAGKLKAMLPREFLGDSLDLTIVNDGTADGDVLNHQCGADFVKVSFRFTHLFAHHTCAALHYFRQVEQRSPKGLESVVGERCCSFDGDADRVMYFFNDGKRFRMLDGDKIATLGKMEISYLRQRKLQCFSNCFLQLPPT